MPSIDLTYLNGPDVAALALTDDEILAAVEGGLRAQGLGQTVIEPRVHLVPESSAKGHFNVLRGVVGPLGVAGVKVVGDFVDNWKQGLPSELAVLTLFDPDTGAPRAILDASVLTDMRTGAMSALGAKHLARQGREGAGPHRRPRHGLLERPAHRPAVRLRRDPRAFAAAGEPPRLRREALARPRQAGRRHGRLGIVRARRRHRRRGVAPAGAAAAAAHRMDQARRPRHPLRHDERGRDHADRHHGRRSSSTIGASASKGMPFGALRRHVDEGKLHEGNLHAELGQIVAGRKPGRERDDETNLFWHRGLSLSDIALGCALLDKARRVGRGQTLRFQ